MREIKTVAVPNAARTVHSMYQELVANSRHTAFEPDAFMRQLIEAETAERTVRSMAYQMGAARFPMDRDLAGFDFTSGSVDETLVRGFISARLWKPHRPWC